MTWDYLIVGAGFAGTVLAERLASQRGATCLVIDRRAHIAGNASDRYDAAGGLIHPYGPHYFRPTSDRTVGYLSGQQEAQLARAVVLAYDLEVALLDKRRRSCRPAASTRTSAGRYQPSESRRSLDSRWFVRRGVLLTFVTTAG